MVAVEVPHCRVHALVLLPGLGDHHQYRLGQGVPAHVEQLQDLVETGRVGDTGGADREDPFEVRNQVGRQEALAGSHEIAVALDGVDLAVVGDHPVGMGKRPHRERVGGEPGVYESDGALDAVVVQVDEEVGQLQPGEHALVDEGPA